MLFNEKIDTSLQLMMCGKKNLSKKILKYIKELPIELIEEIKQNQCPNNKVSKQGTKTVTSELEKIKYSYEINDKHLIIESTKFDEQNNVVEKVFLLIKQHDIKSLKQKDKLDLGTLLINDFKHNFLKNSSEDCDFVLYKNLLGNFLTLEFTNFLGENTSFYYPITNNLLNKVNTPIDSNFDKTENNPKKLIRKKTTK